MFRFRSHKRGVKLATSLLLLYVAGCEAQSVYSNYCGVALSAQMITVTVFSSLLSGLVGVLVSTWVFYKLERHKQKLDLARRLLGNRFKPNGDAFSCALNELMGVFADSDDVLLKLQRFYEALQAHGKPAADAALIDLLKAVCNASKLSQATLNDAYFLKTFNSHGQSNA